MGIEEVGKEVDENFIRVMIGGEPYIVLLDLGAPISLVGPRILNKNRGRLQKVKGHVRSGSGSPIETQEILRTFIEVHGHVSQLDLRATEDLRYDMVLGMDFGVERGGQIHCREDRSSVESTETGFPW